MHIQLVYVCVWVCVQARVHMYICVRVFITSFFVVVFFLMRVCARASGLFGNFVIVASNNPLTPTVSARVRFKN